MSYGCCPSVKQCTSDAHRAEKRNDDDERRLLHDLANVWQFPQPYPSAKHAGTAISVTTPYFASGSA